MLEDNIPDTKLLGITNFAGKMFTILAGLIFQITVTRRLDPEDFALHQLVLSIISAFVVPVSLISYWSSRDSVRERR